MQITIKCECGNEETKEDTMQVDNFSLHPLKCLKCNSKNNILISGKPIMPLLELNKECE